MMTIPWHAVFLPALLGLACAFPAHAELTWKQKLIEVKADPSMGVAEARFTFTNGTAKAIDIRQVESDCGCTTADLVQRHYEPGQGGEIVARFTLGNHVGPQRKTVAVKTNDQSEPTILTLVTDIPEMVRIKPAFVTWSKGDEKKPKSLVLETVNDLVLQDIDLKNSNPSMKVEMEPLVKGHKYQITVTPGSTDGFAFSTLSLDCRFGKDVTRTFHTYATVKPSAAAE